MLALYSHDSQYREVSFLLTDVLIVYFEEINRIEKKRELEYSSNN